MKKTSPPGPAISSTVLLHILLFPLAVLSLLYLAAAHLNIFVFLHLKTLHDVSDPSANGLEKSSPDYSID